MKLFSKKLVGSVVFVLFHLSTRCWCQTNEDRHNSVPTIVYYVGEGKTANLDCENVTDDSVKWYKRPTANGAEGGSDMLMSHRCQSSQDDDEKAKCEFVLTNTDESHFKSTLRIRSISVTDYGSYECIADGKVQSFELRGDLKATRKSLGKDKTTERSVVIVENDTLYLYCNFTGVEPEEDISKVPFLTISWFKDNEDITTNLTGRKSNFESFEKVPHNAYRGKVTHDLRGEYTCSIDIDPSDTKIHKKQFPVEYKFKVRVRASNGWMLPGIVLLIEILALGIFTACIWKREEAKEDAVDADFADSEDEDEPPKST